MNDVFAPYLSDARSERGASERASLDRPAAWGI
jgi:hypothetical protein